MIDYIDRVAIGIAEADRKKPFPDSEWEDWCGRATYRDLANGAIAAMQPLLASEYEKGKKAGARDALDRYVNRNHEMGQ